MLVTAAGICLVSTAASGEAFILAGVAVGVGFGIAQPARPVPPAAPPATGAAAAPAGE